MLGRRACSILVTLSPHTLHPFLWYASQSGSFCQYQCTYNHSQVLSFFLTWNSLALYGQSSWYALLDVKILLDYSLPDFFLELQRHVLLLASVLLLRLGINDQSSHWDTEYGSWATCALACLAVCSHMPWDISRPSNLGRYEEVYSLRLIPANKSHRASL